MSFRGCLGHSMGRGLKVNPEGLTESSVTSTLCLALFRLHTFCPDLIALATLNLGLPSYCFCHFSEIRSLCHGSGCFVGDYLVKLNYGAGGDRGP